MLFSVVIHITLTETFDFNTCMSIMLGVLTVYCIDVCFGPYSSDGKESACNAGDPGLILGLGRSSGEGNGNPLQYSCLENPMERGAWRATVHGVAKSWTKHTHTHTHSLYLL